MHRCTTVLPSTEGRPLGRRLVLSLPRRLEATLVPLILLLLALSNGIKLLLGHLSFLAMHDVEKHLHREAAIEMGHSLQPNRVRQSRLYLGLNPLSLYVVVFECLLEILLSLHQL